MTVDGPARTAPARTDLARTDLARATVPAAQALVHRLESHGLEYSFGTGREPPWPVVARCPYGEPPRTPPIQPTSSDHRPPPPPR